MSLKINMCINYHKKQNHLQTSVHYFYRDGFMLKSYSAAELQYEFFSDLML